MPKSPEQLEPKEQEESPEVTKKMMSVLLARKFPSGGEALDVLPDGSASLVQYNEEGIQTGKGKEIPKEQAIESVREAIEYWKKQLESLEKNLLQIKEDTENSEDLKKIKEMRELLSEKPLLAVSPNKPLHPEKHISVMVNKQNAYERERHLSITSDEYGWRRIHYGAYEIDEREASAILDSLEGMKALPLRDVEFSIKHTKQNLERLDQAFGALSR